VNKSFNGTKLGEKIWLEEPNEKELKMLDKFSLKALPRIGIASAKTKKWRFKLC
jgi:3-methyladenine DNA glycosylase Mpg